MQDLLIWLENEIFQLENKNKLGVDDTSKEDFNYIFAYEKVIEKIKELIKNDNI